jgi:hypothetical protein
MLSRRQFLQATGIAVAAAHLPSAGSTTPTAPSFEAVYGRALISTPVYAAPSTAAPLIKQLWSDTVVPIYGTEGEWYRLRRGYTPCENVQPMIAPARRAEATFAPPFWGEVSGAIAVVRAWCSPSAPVVARVGHGGVLRVIDRLPGDSINWYGVAPTDSSELLGWAFAAILSPAQVDEAAPTLSLFIETRYQRLTVREADQTLLTAPISTGCDLLPGVYPVTQRYPALADRRHGAPWSLAFGDDLILSGVYWHNRFGARAPGAAVQVAPALAKWLYPRAAEVIIS